MQIRIASIRDLEAIIALNAFAQRQHADALPNLFKAPTESTQTKDAFLSFLNDTTGLMLLAEDERPVGCLWAQFQNRPESWVRVELRQLYIQHLVVAPQWRRKGVGRLLLNQAIEIARQQGVKRVELDVWSFNTEAICFYKSNGFEVFNEKMVLRIDASDINPAHGQA